MLEIVLWAMVIIAASPVLLFTGLVLLLIVANIVVGLLDIASSLVRRVLRRE